MDPEAGRKLLVAALEGDARALAVFLGQIHPRLVLWAATRMSPEIRAHCEPEDIAQETVLAVHRDFNRLAPRAAEQIQPWIFGVAENRLRDLVDRIRAAKRNGEPPRAGRQSTPSSVAARKESVQRLMEALASLSDDHREVIRLRRFEGLPSIGAAERMGRSDVAVRALYVRAMRALREAMEIAERRAGRNA